MHRKRTLLAAVTRVVAATLTLSIALAGMPAAAQEVRDPAPAAPSALRQSIDRAVQAAGTVPQDGVSRAALSAEERADVSHRARRLQTNPVAGQAPGGGGTLKTIVTLVGIAASVWGTWYMIQYMKKQQEREQGFRP